jgi:hypothetical protein
VERQESSSFLKKRTKKLLLDPAHASRIGRFNQHGKSAKVFCFFFSKKKYFLASLPLPKPCHMPARRA